MTLGQAKPYQCRYDDGTAADAEQSRQQTNKHAHYYHHRNAARGFVHMVFFSTHFAHGTLVYDRSVCGSPLRPITVHGAAASLHHHPVP